MPVGDFFNRITSFRPDKVIIFVNIENSVHIFPDYFELTFVIFRRIFQSLGRDFVRGTQIRLGRIRRKNGLCRSSRISYRQIAACNEIFVIIGRRNIDYNRIYFTVAFRYSFEIFIGGRNFITILAVLDCRKVSAELFKEGFGRCKHSVIGNLARLFCQNRDSKTKPLIVARKSYARSVNVFNRNRNNINRNAFRRSFAYRFVHSGKTFVKSVFISVANHFHAVFLYIFSRKHSGKRDFAPNYVLGLNVVAARNRHGRFIYYLFVINIKRNRIGDKIISEPTRFSRYFKLGFKRIIFGIEKQRRFTVVPLIKRFLFFCFIVNNYRNFSEISQIAARDFVKIYDVTIKVAALIVAAVTRKGNGFRSFRQVFIPAYPQVYIVFNNKAAYRTTFNRYLV